MRGDIFGCMLGAVFPCGKVYKMMWENSASEPDLELTSKSYLEGKSSQLSSTA